MSTFTTYRRLLRAEQWYKNAMVFLPLILVPTTERHTWLQLFLAFAGLCFASSISYLINDWRDRERDRLHPTKKERPLAAGHVSGDQAFQVGSTLALLLIVIGYWLGGFYSQIIVLHLLVSTAYSFGAKDIPLVDIALIAVNFVLRFLAGFTMLPDGGGWLATIFVFALIIDFLTHKRRSDRKLLGDVAADHKPVLRAYTESSCIALRVLSFLVLGASLLAMFNQGYIAFLTVIFTAGLLGYTSLLFSKDPLLVMKPHKLVDNVWWGVLFLATIASAVFL